MHCPACKELMMTIEMDQVEVDCCVGCGGVWLDQGEVELLLDSSEDLFLSSFKINPNSKEKSRDCPICSKTMEKVFHDAREKINLDRCRKKHGLWFDHGELETILKAGHLGIESRVARLLQNLFSRKEK